MWYALRCSSGEAVDILQLSRRFITKGKIQDIFTFTFDRMKRYQGQWHIENALMFPNYIFLESKDEDINSDELKQCWDFVKAEDVPNTLFKVLPEEERFLRSLCDSSHHLKLSRGYICDGITHIDEGPLRGLECYIRKIDRHKRMARLEVPLHYVNNTMWAGLEIFYKS
ncbi:hypothetical protein MCG98_10225 [Ruminococcus sp. OA3]|uniref:transcription termination/antitermination NusG family protein n=1 Tax=Ruminococcus sp. OA3 TaxID=2914164 RepID=UPI001F05B0BB|nr:hypothetical protein [Ruminococcus sp. OA3]MCH1982940.1 hypothetical protein [Ruminococcus sp. OA3]